MDDEKKKNSNNNSDKDGLFDHFKIYKWIANIILFAGLIGGYILGDDNKITKVTYQSSISSEFDKVEKTFNTALMLYVWIGTFLIYAIFRGFSAVLKKQETIINSVTSKTKIVDEVKTDDEMKIEESSIDENID